MIIIPKTCTEKEKRFIELHINRYPNTNQIDVDAIANDLEEMRYENIQEGKRLERVRAELDIVHPELSKEEKNQRIEDLNKMYEPIHLHLRKICT